MLSANVAYASKPGSVYFLDITPGQYIHYKSALDDINRAHENDHTILMLYMCLDCYANACCHTNVLYQTFFEAMSNFYKYWDTRYLESWFGNDGELVGVDQPGVQTELEEIPDQKSSILDNFQKIHIILSYNQLKLDINTVITRDIYLRVEN